LKTGFDNRGPISAYIEGRNLPTRRTFNAYISSASIINQATATSPLFEPGNGRAVFAGMKYRW
jgi:iron complex outermembrane receptor protein